MSQVQADAIHDRYRKSFVGRARATRDLSVLDGIIAEADALLPTLSGDLKAAMAERLALYKTERGEIASIQASGPAALAGWRAVEWSEVNLARYRRHFSGKNRVKADVGLLGEMAAEEKANLAAIPAKADSRLASQKELVANNVKLFEAELVAIPAARTAAAPVEQARILASAANQQFESWRRHFEGKSRATRRPATLQRMIDQLDAIGASMVAVRAMGVSGATLDANITKVTERAAHFRLELEKIKSARAQMAGDELARRLGDEANAIFSAYRAEYTGKTRAAADSARLSDLCDQLQEIGRTMKLLQEERPVEGAAKNLTVVLDHLKMMEREFQKIGEAKAAAKSNKN